MQIQSFPSLATGHSEVNFVIQAASSGLALSTFSGVTLQFVTSSGTGTIPLQVNTDCNGNATLELTANRFNGKCLVSTAFNAQPSQVASTQFTNNSISEYANTIANLFQAFVSIPRYEEPMLIAENGQSAKAGWGKWNYDPYNPPVIMKNTDIWLDNNWINGTGYVIDYQRGQIYFQSPLLPGDDLRCSYNFSLMRPEDYIPFIHMALSTLNMKNPITQFEFSANAHASNVPPQWFGTIISGACAQAAKMLLMKMNMFAFRRLFEDPNYICDQLRANAAEWSHDFELQIAQKRRGYALPASIKTYNQGIPWQTNESNFLALTVLGSPTLTN